MTPHILHALQGQPIALLTQHGKEKLLAPLIESSLGCKLLHIDCFDTDQLGTFTRDIPRHGSQLDAARKKAQLAAQFANNRFTLSSEGAFVTDPWSGMLPWNIELILLKDHDTGMEWIGIAQGAAVNNQQIILNRDELAFFAESAGFPEHHLVIRPDHALHPDCIKGINNWEDLQRHYAAIQQKSKTSHVSIENDLRAHCNPTRQKMIVRAAEDLLLKLHSNCPVCKQPGFWVEESIKGLPCRVCLSPTKKTKAERWLCPHCQYEQIKPAPQETGADPMFCPECNP